MKDPQKFTQIGTFGIQNMYAIWQPCFGLKKQARFKNVSFCVILWIICRSIV
jgi:hypothetical protein